MSEPDFCLIHGYSHMHRRSGEIIDTCEMCEAIGDAVDAKDAEIAKLQADLSEAMEIMQSMMISMRPTDGAWINLEVHKSDLKKARSFLDRTGK